MNLFMCACVCMRIYVCVNNKSLIVNFIDADELKGINVQMNKPYIGKMG